LDSPRLPDHPSAIGDDSGRIIRKAAAGRSEKADPVKTGIVFPGMGPWGYGDLGKFMATNPHARKLRRTADAVLGYPLMDRYRAAGSDYSEYSQIAFLISCLALIEQVDTEPAACAGPSFGGKAAVAYSAALPVDEVIMLAARLARCEEEYFATEHEDVVTQSIARTPGPVLAEILASMTQRNEWHDISCHIDEDFYMVSMREASLGPFLKEVRAAGGLPLYVMRPPMHSSVFGALRRKAEDEVLGDLPFSDPRLPIIADHDGSVVTTADGVRAMLLDSFVRAVRWPWVVRSMRELDVTKVYIPGPDSLFGRVRCTTRNFAVVPIKPSMPEGRRSIHVE
jgi:[acyl-carrier-protein] S-malonyltransferase